MRLFELVAAAMQPSNAKKDMSEIFERPKLEPLCLAATIGSVPHTDAKRGTKLVLEKTPDIPAWVQFPKRALHENMMVQFTEGMPGLLELEERIVFDTSSPSFVNQLTGFYDRYLAATDAGDVEALEYFSISEDYAAGFGEFLSQLPHHMETHNVFMLKGQVTGPFTLGTNLLDQDGRSSYYDDQLHDVIVKSVEMKALWQMSRLREFGVPLMVFLDEPALLGFGSQTFITISRENVTADINAVAKSIHKRGGLAGVHCEANTDWSLLMETELDVLDFDAYDHMQSITLYPAELRTFLDRGGWLGWGIIPTLDKEAAANETVPSLLVRFDEGVEMLVSKGFDREVLMRRALITPSCGAGGVLTEVLAERVFDLLREFSLVLRQREGFA
jgi:hypothetical protein